MLPKYEHEIRDPIHTFIRVSSDERRVIDSRAFQRLRRDEAVEADGLCRLAR